MTQPRKALIALESTPYYHCVSRCVRRAFLCGFDKFTARSFEHRRGWIVARLKLLASVFAIDIAAYAVMSNHYHVVLRVDRQRAERWDAQEVFSRWAMLFRGPLLMQKFMRGDPLLVAELAVVDQLCALYRDRLSDISWLMRCLNEAIARAANAEDGCTGRFWEGRFKSQALLDDAALLSCMAYVDLNPIRAGMARTPEDSDYTSIQERLGVSAETSHPESESECGRSVLAVTRPRAVLMPFAGNLTQHTVDTALPFALIDYLELVDWTGRAIRGDKRGVIPEKLPPILQRLGIESAAWLETTHHFGRLYYHAIGPAATLEDWCRRLGQRWLQGKRACALLYPDPSPA